MKNVKTRILLCAILLMICLLVFLGSGGPSWSEFILFISGYLSAKAYDAWVAYQEMPHRWSCPECKTLKLKTNDKSQLEEMKQKHLLASHS